MEPTIRERLSTIEALLNNHLRHHDMWIGILSTAIFGLAIAIISLALKR